MTGIRARIKIARGKTNQPKDVKTSCSVSDVRLWWQRVGDSWDQDGDTGMAASAMEGCYQYLHGGVAEVNFWATLWFPMTAVSAKIGCRT